MPRFTVDTHLFRELGELLVGRSSTALIELIKNAYDADATVVHVSASNLADPAQGLITVVDDGVGMTDAEFTDGFLRIAARRKQEGTRRSLKLQRRFTGAKGIGRLAAHKLAHELDVTSIPSPEKLADARPYQLVATIDWDAIEAKRTLDETEDAVTLEKRRLSSGASHGTTIRLRRLRRAWTPTERQNFYNEISTFRPPSALVEPLARGVVRQPVLFETPQVRDQRARDPGFDVRLEGDLASGDDPWAEFAEAASWILEVRARKAGVDYAIAPALRTLSEVETAQPMVVHVEHPDPKNGPFFDARVFIREGRAPKAMQSKIRAAAGVRIYMEGFRVLPYGEPGNDWLGVAREYAIRVGGLPLDDDDRFGPAIDREGFTRPTNEQLHGAVFLLERNAPNLRLLVNREGFVPEAGYEHLVTIMTRGINLSTRARAAATEFTRRERRGRRDAELRQRDEQESQLRVAQRELEESLAQAAIAARAAQKSADAGDERGTRQALSQVVRQLTVSTSASEDLISEQGLLRVLASVGTQMAAFIHELNRIVENVVALEQLVESQGTARLRRLVGDVRRSLERQASYLIDVIGPDTRRRRSRQRVAERLEIGWRFVADAAAGRGITFDHDIESTLRMPPMFPAETAAVFTNLLGNAVKAAGERGRIRARASEEDDHLVVRIENTGVAVDLADSGRWFEPFQSTTTEVDPVLGQGLGLGLSITREILAQYGATIEFVKPRRGFATAIEIVFP
jgi:signal transduction histidine kinase